MNEITITDVETPMVEFVFRCTNKKVWISIESLSDNKIVDDVLKSILKTGQANELCIEICKALDDIYDIDSNKIKLINVINALSKKEKKITIVTLYSITEVVFDKKENEFIHKKMIGFGSNGLELRYIQNNNEYDRVNEYLIECKSTILKLANIIYYSIEGIGEI